MAYSAKSAFTKLNKTDKLSVALQYTAICDFKPSLSEVRKLSDLG